MKLIQLSAMLVWVLFWPMGTQADTARSVDVTGFDIAGVKLGMSQTQALQAITNYLNVDRSAVVFDKFPKKNIIDGEKRPAHFSIEINNANYTVRLERNLIDIKDPLEMVVSAIEYTIPWSAENDKSIKQAVIKKYGPPSNGTLGVQYEYCSEPSSNIGIGCSFSRGKPILTVGQTGMKLEDPKYRDAFVAYLNKQKETTPNF